ncbi:MAG: S9 family peptidase [Terriglobia bacterium]|nr:S9 family peptidase [Terriglobia bacterium]
MIRRIFLAITLFCLALPLLAQTKRPFTFEDMMKLKRIGDFTVSPDSKWVTFSAVDVNLDANTRKSHLWIVPVAGGESRRLTAEGSSQTEDRLRFAPDAKRVLYTIVRDGHSQIWTQDFDPEQGALVGAPHEVTNISTDADGAIWSPDGKSILFVSAVYPDCRDDACNKQRDEAAEKSKVKAKIFTHLLYRHWTAYSNGKRSHLFLVEADCDAEGGNTACAGRDLTPGDHDVPPFSLGGQDQYQFSPDGKEIAYTSNLDEVEATSTNSDVFTLSLTDPNAKPKNLTAENKGSDSTPMYSPDGKWLAIRSQFRAGYESDRFRLRLIDRATGKITNLTENWDRWVDSMGWAADSKALLVTAGNEGEAPIYVVSITAPLNRKLASGETLVPQALVPHGTNDSPMAVSGIQSNAPLASTTDPNKGIVVFARNSVAFPTELFVLDLKRWESAASAWDCPTGKAPCPEIPQAQQLTHLNDAVLSGISMQPVESFWFTGSEKAKVQGFIVKPPNFDASKKYPVKFLIHGGPQGAWGDDWSFRWNPNLFAADGYVIVMINPRGSTGYGQKFIDDINGDWGGRAYQDLMLGLDYAEKTYPFIDKNRECALGASYGGYMANWILGHTTRFKCIVSHDGMFNSESAWGTTEELWFNEWEFKGTPWTNRELYRKWSPHLFAANFKTPTLVVHSQLDYRLDVSEGFQLFTTLQRLGVPSKMLYFPDEGHWVLKPQNSQLWWKTVGDWVDQWTKK